METTEKKKFYEIIGETYSDMCKAKESEAFWYNAYQTAQEAAKKAVEENEYLKAEMEQLKVELEQLRDSMAATVEAGEGEAV